MKGHYLLLILCTFLLTLGGAFSLQSCTSITTCQGHEGVCISSADGYFCDCFSGCGGPLPHGIYSEEGSNLSQPNVVISVGKKVQFTISVPTLSSYDEDFSISHHLTSKLKFGNSLDVEASTSCDFPNHPGWVVSSSTEDSEPMEIFTNSFDYEQIKNCGFIKKEGSATYESTIYFEKNLISTGGKLNFHRKYVAEKSVKVTLYSLFASITKGNKSKRDLPDYAAVISKVEYGNAGSNPQWTIELTTQHNEAAGFFRFTSVAPTGKRGFKRTGSTPSPAMCTTFHPCEQVATYSIDGYEAISGVYEDKLEFCATETTSPCELVTIAMDIRTSSAEPVSTEFPLSDSDRTLTLYKDKDYNTKYGTDSPPFGTSDSVYFEVLVKKPPKFSCPSQGAVVVPTVCAYTSAPTKALCGDRSIGPGNVEDTEVKCDGSEQFKYTFTVKGEALKSKVQSGTNSFYVQADVTLYYESSKRSLSEQGAGEVQHIIAQIEVVDSVAQGKRAMKRGLDNKELIEEDSEPSSASQTWISLLIIASALCFASF
eukprot:TRINITY_DN603_c0_g1_i1.p1 TRINITY_DN603_c0_g1~~TRINITY_DN603_c0_g1_i1.p1  ORF type:complete len:559 (-),score=108.02 TRINITY_DN603_c0_g1_i1:66-1685(-)